MHAFNYTHTLVIFIDFESFKFIKIISQYRRSYNNTVFSSLIKIWICHYICISEGFEGLCYYVYRLFHRNGNVDNIGIENIFDGITNVRIEKKII